MQWKCPICGTPVIEDYRDSSDLTLLESADHCPNGCYEHTFGYGHVTERIGKQWWEWSHHETDREFKIRRYQKDVVIHQIRNGNVNFKFDETEPNLKWQELGF